MPARRIGGTVEQPVEGGVAGASAGRVGADDDRSGAASYTANGGTAARRNADAPAGASPSAVDAHTDGEERDDERAAVGGGGTRDPRADKPRRGGKKWAVTTPRTGARVTARPGLGGRRRGGAVTQPRPEPRPSGGASSDGDRRRRARDDAQAEGAPPPAQPAGEGSAGGGTSGEDSTDDGATRRGRGADEAEPSEDGRTQQSGVGPGGKGGRG